MIENHYQMDRTFHYLIAVAPCHRARAALSSSLHLVCSWNITEVLKSLLNLIEVKPIPPEGQVSSCLQDGK